MGQIGIDLRPKNAPPIASTHQEQSAVFFHLALQSLVSKGAGGRIPPPGSLRYENRRGRARVCSDKAVPAQRLPMPAVTLVCDPFSSPRSAGLCPRGLYTKGWLIAPCRIF